MLRCYLILIGVTTILFSGSVGLRGAMFTFPDRWEVSVDDGILDSRLIFDENEYVGMYTLHKESFSRDDYEEALVSCDKTEEIEKIVRGKFSDIYTDITLVAFRKREIDGRNIIELSFKGASKRVVTPIFIKLSSIAQGDSKSMEVLTMHNMEKHKSIADSEIDDILATVRL